MIVVSNKFIPVSKKRRGIKKSQQPIANTDSGDEAFYSTIPVEMDDESESDDDDDDIVSRGVSKYMLGKKLPTLVSHRKPLESITGADWRPVFNDRMTMFIAGTPGAGKSYLAKQMINLLPSNIPILLFTALEEHDGNFDELGKDRIYKIKMSTDTLDKINLAGIRERVKTPQTILLFDDVDKIRDPKVQNATFALMNDALANGRGHEKHDGTGDIHVICTSHSANDYKKTKYTFENSNYVALFPGTTPPLQMYRMFDKLGLEKELCQKMINLARAQQIRSIIIHKVVPMYLIYGDKIMQL